MGDRCAAEYTANPIEENLKQISQARHKKNLKKKISGTAQSGRGGRCDSKLLGEYDGHGLVKISRSYARKTLWPAPGVYNNRMIIM